MALAEAPSSQPSGPTPPYSLEAERSVLGAILLSDRTLYGLVIRDGLRPEDFYRPQHGVIYEAMLKLYGEAEPVDAVTVKEWLRSHARLDEAGGEASIDTLAVGVPAAVNVRHYAGIVKEQALARRLLTTAYGIAESVVSRAAQPRDLVERAERAILEVAHDDRQKDFQRIDDILEIEIEKLHRLSTEKTALTGTPSGFRDLDEITGGFQPGNLVVLAARPSMGKSALVCNIAENAAVEYGKPVALFSLEMSEAELAQRFIASQSNTKGEELRKGRVSESRWPKILAASQKLAQSPLFVDDSSDVGILEIRAKARRLHQQNPEGIGMIIIDYLQLMRAEPGVENRVLQIGEMSRGLKILARELNVPVIALSQLSRAVEQRHDKRPILSDLRESGAIEQDADLVMFIYRDEYYNDNSEAQGEAELIISKHRNGALGVVRLVFQRDLPKFLTHAGDRFSE
jgi:replicative DNA helicase